MISRREFGWGAFAGLVPELAFSQHAAVLGDAPPGTVWLNANENPDGVPEAAKAAVARAISDAGRYHHRAFPAFYAALARSAGVNADQVISGAGSTEVIHCALEAFTSATRPLITAWPTWEMAREVTEAAAKPVVRVPLDKDWCADVERMAAEAKRHGGGLIHLGNPNNPTSSVTAGARIAWLADHLPPNTVVLVDEAYIQFTDPREKVTAMALVAAGKNVVVTRTFSKLYGMAGMRIGFGCARADLIRKMQPFRNNVGNILSVRAATAALELGEAFVDERRSRRIQVRKSFCAWLDRRSVEYIPPQANFVLIHIGRDVRELIPRFLAAGVAVGRRFEAMPDWLRVAVGTESEMEKLETAFQRLV